ncbi:MAG: sugar-binding domain-containing protein, partial [Sciscionella sp.]
MTGRVVDADTDVPVAGAVVHAAGDERSYPVGEHGEFSLPLGEVPAVVAGAQGYAMCWHVVRDGGEPMLLRLSPETPGSVPHPDYPRPDCDRRPGSDGKWLSLNGTWSLRFDPDVVGLREGWAGDAGYEHLVRVPFSYTSLAGVGEQARAQNTCYASQFADRRGVVWYRREFTVPADFAAGRHTLLRFGAVEWHATVFLDGAQVARHDGGYSPFDVDIGTLAPGTTHSLVVRVVVPDNSERTPYPQGKQTSWYTDTGGIWQSVWLEQADPARLGRVHVTPRIAFDGTVLTAQACVELSANQPDAVVRLRVRAPAGEPGVAALPGADDVGRPREPSVGEVVAETTVLLD